MRTFLVHDWDDWNVKRANLACKIGRRVRTIDPVLCKATLGTDGVTFCWPGRWFWCAIISLLCWRA